MTNWDTIRHECPRLYKHGVIFECGLGWYDLLRDLSIKIENILEEHEEKYKVLGGNEDEYVEMFAVQVKEKHGTLRFYMNCETDEIGHVIEEVEILSLKTCEVCGDSGITRGKYWCEVRCEKCFQEESIPKNDLIRRKMTETEVIETPIEAKENVEVEENVKPKRTIVRFKGDISSAINLEHVTNMFQKGKSITFEFYTKSQVIDFPEEDEASKAFDFLINIWTC